jgi:hypothetical protein
VLNIDFLGREADAAGLTFWTNNITSCGANAACIESRRVETSASFFLSIEFQETGGMHCEFNAPPLDGIRTIRSPLIRISGLCATVEQLDRAWFLASREQKPCSNKISKTC